MVREARFTGCAAPIRARSFRYRRTFAVVLILMAGKVWGAYAQAEAPSELPQPAVEPTPLNGFDNDRSYVKAMAGRAADLAHQAEQAADPATRVDLLLRAANVILANELEPACTSKLLHLDDEQVPVIAEEVRAALDRADLLLAKATEGVRAEADASPEPQGNVGNVGKASRNRLKTLEAFARGLRAFLLPEKGDEAGRAARQAASGLAALLEDEDPQVAAAAALWHACLRSRDADPLRALALLDLALWDPPPNSLPFSLHARLLRCRLIAAEGGHAAALALLTQIEERCDAWLPDDAARADAIRTAALAQIQILRDWHAQLTDPTDTRERQWCVDRAKRLTDEHFGTEPRRVLRLSPAVPLLEAPPDQTTRDPETPAPGG